MLEAKSGVLDIKMVVNNQAIVEFHEPCKSAAVEETHVAMDTCSAGVWARDCVY